VATRKTVPTKIALMPPIIATALPPARPFRVCLIPVHCNQHPKDRETDRFAD
jgi:hypothetical protein